MLERSLAGRFAQLTNRALPRFFISCVGLCCLCISHQRPPRPPRPHIIEYQLPHLQSLQSLNSNTSHHHRPRTPPISTRPLHAHQRPPPLPDSTHNHTPPPPPPRLTPQPNLYLLYPPLHNPYSCSRSHGITGTPSSSGTLHPALPTTLPHSAPALPRAPGSRSSCLRAHRALACSRAAGYGCRVWCRGGQGGV